MPKEKGPEWNYVTYSSCRRRRQRSCLCSVYVYF